ncbi:unnamed protein product [Paramecium primaurelia]|uniref:Transmembrane protein n=1 Tax=Paramecium primaurelia TaxID=5886 RepID=A0A8S1MRE3_PARPR|nr:unnamed protein product [Paramecium primaurelia]
MNWKILGDFISLIIQTNLSPSLNNQFFTSFQITFYYLQLTYFLVSENHEYIYRLINTLSRISLITPIFIDSYSINMLIGIIIILINIVPYIIITYRKITNKNNNISKSILQMSTMIVNYYFLYFSWFLYLPQLYYVGWNYIYSSASLLILASIVLILTILSLIISNVYFINFEFNEQHLRKHFSYSDLLAQLLMIPMALLYLNNDTTTQLISRILHGLILIIQIYDAYFSLPLGFSASGLILNRALMTHSVIFTFSSIKALSTASPYSLATIMLIMQPVVQYLFQILFESKRSNVYISSNITKNQYYDLLYIEDFFELSQLAQKNKQIEIEFIQKLVLHTNRCNSTKCQCRKIEPSKILQFNQIVIMISCLFKGSFEKYKHHQLNLRVFEIFSLKFLTFINKYKHNAPKSYQELKILFQKKRDYSFYFIQMCLVLQQILQAQLRKDEDYNINKDTRVSNVKLQVSKSEHSIVQDLYQMEQVKNNIIPLLLQVGQFKQQFWKSFKEGKFSEYSQIEKEVRKLQQLRDNLILQFNVYQPIFYHNGRTFNVQFLKFNALINLLLFNNLRKYFELEKERKEILQFEKSMNSFEITNINFFKGEAISVKVCIAFGPNIGKVMNKVISPLIPKFFGFGHFQHPLNSFIDYTKGNINQLMPAWLEPVHDEMMQNYIRRGVTARIGKYFQTFAKLYDKTLIKCQVYLAHNFSQELEDDFTMIGCLKSLEEEQPKFIGDDGKRLKNVAFKGYQYVLFDLNGNIMGITRGIYKMIEKMQRLVVNKGTYHEIDQLKSSNNISKSDNSSQESESYNAFDQKWSNIELSIDDFYGKVFIWMILPFISREIESTGIEFLMNGQTPPKNRYQNLTDLDISNLLVQNKETYLFIPEDINLFVQQYEKILQKIVDDVRVQSNNFSSGSAYKAQKSDYQEIDQFNTVTIFNEKLCVFFYDEHLKRHQTLNFGQTRQSEMVKVQGKPSSRSSIQEKQSSNSESQEDSEQLKTRAERIYQDRYSRYIEKFSPQDFHPVPVMYSVSYEEYRYRKNEIDHKQQIFVVELVVNEQQLLNTEKGYRRQLRDTIKQIYQNYQSKKQLLEQQTDEEDSISVQANFSEQKSVHDKEITNYQFPSHPSHYFDDAFLFDNKEVLITDQIFSPKQDDKGDFFLLSNRSKQSKPLLEVTERNSKDSNRKNKASIQSEHSVGDAQFKGSKLNITEKEIAQSVFIKFSQRKKQQEFYNENESKLPQESKDSQQQIFEEYQVKYTENLKLFETQYNLVQSQLNIISNPYSYRIQKYLFSATFILIICFIILISTSTQGQYDLTNCLNLIELMITTQTSFSQITHSLYRNEITNQLQIKDMEILKQFYNNQFFGQLQELINIQNDYVIKINQANLNVEQFFDIENRILKNITLQEVIQLSLGQFYKLKQTNNNHSFIVDSSMTFSSVANLKEIGELPQKAHQQCYQENLNDHQYSQNILIVYMVITFFLVMMLQFTQIPLISKLRRNHRTLYKEIIKLQPLEVNEEIDIYDGVVNIFKRSIYEWMLIDFVQETQMFDINRQRKSIAHTPGLQKINNPDLGQSSNSNKKNTNKLMEKLKKSKMNQNKYISILMAGLLVILAYFLVVFLIIFMLSKDIISNIDTIFQSKLAQSSIINLINNVDLLAYSTLSNNIYDNIMNISQFQTYSEVLSDNSTDMFFEKYKNQLLSSFVDESLYNNFNILNEKNICTQEVGIDCSLTDAISLNPGIIANYEQGMKSLLTQVSTIIAQYPQFYETDNIQNSEQILIEFYNNQYHILYIDYGSEILIKAYKQLISIEKDLFNQLLDVYKKLLLIFTLSVGLFGLIIILFLGKYLLKMQKDSIDTCLTALLLVSPKRYLSKQLGLVIQKKL